MADEASSSAETPVAVASRTANGVARRESDGRRRSVGSIWSNRNFLLLWLAQAISQTAQNAIWFGIVVLVQQRSHSSTLLSVAVLTLIIPSVIFGVLAGVYVDRWDKRLVLIATNLIRGCDRAVATGCSGCCRSCRCRCCSSSTSCSRRSDSSLPRPRRR